MKIECFIGAVLVSMDLTATGAQATDWTGIYLGGHAGHSYFSADSLPFGSTSEPAGISGGLHAGYQHQLGAFIFGIEGTYTALDIDDFGFTNFNKGTSTATADVGGSFSEIDLGDLNLTELVQGINPVPAGVEATIPAFDISNIDLAQLTKGANPTKANIGVPPPRPDTGDFHHALPHHDAGKYVPGVSDIFTLSARAGYSFGKVMTYGKIGYATAGIGYRDMLDPTPTTLLNYLERENGLLLGAGAEFAITERISIGLDYTYINFDIDTKIQDMDFAKLPSIIEDNLDSDHHQLSVRLNFRFN